MGFRYNCDYCNKDITNESIYKVEVRIQNLNNMCGWSTQYKTYCRDCFINNSVSEARDFRKEQEAKYGIRK